MSFLDCLKMAVYVCLYFFWVFFAAIIFVAGILSAPRGLLLLPIVIVCIALAIWAYETASEV